MKKKLACRTLYYDSETVSINQDTAKNIDHPGPAHKSHTVVITTQKEPQTVADFTERKYATDE
jgi:hypothetical protein